MKWNRLLELIEEENGRLSSSRVSYLAVIFGVLGGWITLSMKAGQLLDIPLGLGTFVAVVITGKVVQRFGEVHPSTEPPPVQPTYQRKLAKRRPIDD
jgi:hypothetical protein